jgi:Na+-transporting NADH:ubiquinone oxidoreductase subunit A
VQLRHGGFTPVLSGRPTGRVEELPPPSSLVIELVQQGLSFKPVVTDGQTIHYGEEIAATEGAFGRLVVAAPAAGTARVGTGDDVHQVIIENAAERDTSPDFAPEALGRASRADIQSTLIRAGIWQGFWSRASGGIPHAESGEPPKQIVVNCIFTEPFRARGDVVIARSWDTIIQGFRNLPRLTADYGRIEIVFTAPNHPLAKQITADLAGFAWVHFHSVSLRYPIEHPAILSDLARRSSRSDKNDGDTWVIGIQDVQAIGAVLSRGQPPKRRIIAVGGPGANDPRHVSAMIGTRVRNLASGEGSAVLRGGIMNGEPVDPASAGITGRDDALFILPETKTREMFGFMRPGFTRTSYSRTFVSGLFGTKDSHITASIRGERRPCIACGSCENVCPVNLLPQVLHRYLYADRIDDAERVGLMRCIDCRLCTYVCPSKIELQSEFSDARAQLLQEREEAERAREDKEPDSEPREDWHEAPKKTS